ncbi:hypothetical protein AX16_009077 [Volvariella volvacea WC 439]|nr:hypothetical protein AX16_009077 [Volvariella volvacea WC 439]
MSQAATKQDISNPARGGAQPGGEKMKALVWMGKNKVQVVEAPKPKILEERDVILRVTGTTICGSDLHLLHGAIPQVQKGDILGHEFCGVVESTGSAVRGLSVGDRVVASFHIACGECKYCRIKLTTMCERTNTNRLENALYGGRTAGLFGYSHLTGGFAGGQAEYVRVPFADVNLMKLPDTIPDEKGLYLSDVLGTAWHCVTDTGVQKDDVVAIWGAGPIGQMCVEYSFLLGASRVICIDSGWRLEFLKSKYPKLELIDYKTLPRGVGVAQRLKEMVPEGEGPDVALECVGGEYAKGWAHYFETMLGMETDTSELVNEMIMSVRSFGRCGIVGDYMGYTNHFNIGALMERGIRLIGNGQSPIQKYWPHLLKMVRDGRVDPLKMVTHRVRLEDLDKVYYKFDRKEDNMQKVFVQTRFSGPECEGSPELTEY